MTESKHKKVQFNATVPTPVQAVYQEWKDGLQNAKHHGLLLSACILVSMNHEEERDALFEQLAAADATGQVAELIESLQSDDDAVAGRVGPETAKPKRKKKAARKKKSKGGNYRADK